MSDDAFLDAILAAPDDDAPRLVYADVLSERGDPRGEFIVVQCAIAKAERGTRAHHELARREARLLDAHAKAWLPEGIASWPGTFERGFVTHLTTSTRSLRASWSELSRRPIASVGLREGATLRALAWISERLPAAKVTLLRAADFASFDPTALSAALADGGTDEDAWGDGGLLAPPLQPALTTLGFEFPPPAEVLAMNLPRLKELTFGYSTRVSAADLRAIVARPDLHALTFLDLGYIMSSGVQVFLDASPPPRRLRELVLRNLEVRPFDDLVAKAFLERPLLRRLEHLDADFALDYALIGALSNEATALHTLIVERAPLDQAHVDALFGSGVVRRLRTLAIPGQDYPTAAALLDAPLSIRSLRLDRFRFDDALARAMVAGLSTVSELTLRDAKFGPNAEAILRERWP